MFLIFKPQFGFDAGGPGGYVIPRTQAAKRRRKPVEATTGAVEPVETEAPPQVTPSEIVSLAAYEGLDEVKLRLEELSLSVELELLKQAEVELQRAREKAQADEEERARQEHAQQVISALLAEGERLLAAEQAEVLEVIDLLDGELWAAATAYEFTRPKPKRRK